jgi:hypothetical protein
MKRHGYYYKSKSDGSLMKFFLAAFLLFTLAAILLFLWDRKLYSNLESLRADNAATIEEIHQTAALSYYTGPMAVICGAAALFSLVCCINLCRTSDVSGRLKMLQPKLEKEIPTKPLLKGPKHEGT